MTERPAAPPQQHVRIPKLAYRNRPPADQTSLSSQNTSSSETPSSEALEDLRPSTTGSTTSSPVQLSFDTRSLASPSLASNSNASSSKDSKTSQKKKSNGMLAFLTLKEPSQSALDQFAEQQRKQAAEKGAKASSFGVHTTNPQKLPVSVPKVNTKWDGIPESVKAKDSLSKKRYSTSTTTSSRATARLSTARDGSILSVASDGTRNPPNSLASAAASVSNFSASTLNAGSERRDSGPSLTEQEKIKQHMSSPSTTTLPEITYFFPDDPSSTAGSSNASHEPSPLSASSVSTSSTSTSLPDNVNSRSSTMDESTIIALTTPPRLISPYPADAITHTQATTSRLSLEGFLAGEARAIEIPADEDEDEDVADDSHDSFFQSEKHITGSTPEPTPVQERSLMPATMNFSRPLSSQSTNPGIDFSRHSTLIGSYKPGFAGLPTLYEASVMSTDTSDTITDSTESIDLTHQPRDSDSISIAPSITPSEMSASWHQTSRERLGLGGRIRKNDVLPWESQKELIPGIWPDQSNPQATDRLTVVENNNNTYRDREASGSALPRSPSFGGASTAVAIGGLRGCSTSPTADESADSLRSRIDL